MSFTHERIVKTISGSLICYLVTGVLPALAQQTANVGLEEVVVTARRKEERLLDTPVTLTALTEEALQSRGISDLGTLAQFTPGLTLNALSGTRSDRGNQQLIIRGMTPTFNGNVSVFIDGAAVTGPGFVAGVDDLARVEVLKGPQSAAFGRSTFAGAVNLVTKDPTDQFHATVDAQVMTYAGHDVRAELEGPLMGDKLGFHFEARTMRTGGDYDNAAEAGEKLGALGTDSASLILKAKPTDNLTVKVMGTYWVNHDGVGPEYIIGYHNFNCAAGATGSTPNYICGQLPKVNFANLALNDQVDAAVNNVLFHGGLPIYLPDVGSNFSNRMGFERHAYHLSGIIGYDIPSIDATLTLNTSYDRQKQQDVLDADEQDSSFIPNPAYTAATAGSLQSFVNWPTMVQFSYEGSSGDIRLQGGAHSRIHWTVGASSIYQWYQNSVEALIQSGPAKLVSPTRTVTNTSGVFGSLGYDILDNLTASFEARYQIDRQAVDSYTATSSTTGQFGFVTSELAKTFLPRAFLQYHPVQNWMIYASYAQGVNPGGFNRNLLTYTPAQQAALTSTFNFGLDIQPEKIRNYELGVKGSFLEGRAQLTADVYHSIWTNQIVSNSLNVAGIAGIGLANNVLQVSQNVGRTTLNGVEAEGEIIPVQGLKLNGGVAYNGSKIDQFICQVCASLITGSKTVTGNRLPTVPAVQFNLGAEYRQALTTSLDGYLRADMTWQGKIYQDATDLAWIAPVGTVNLHAGITRDNLMVEGYVTNLFDNLNYTGVVLGTNQIAPPPGISTNVAALTLPQRRTFGLRVRVSM